MADAVPVISQVKSFVQWASGDSAGAERTQQNFSKRCPVISQARSAVEAISGDTEAARKTQYEFLDEVSNFTDAVPGVRHVKGAVHYACGDTEGGDNAMKAASRTTGAMAGGVGGFFVAGPPGAIAGGIGGAAAMDLITTGVDSAVHDEFRPAGLIQQGVDIAENPTDAGKWFDTGFMVVGDGLAGYAGVEAVVRGEKFVKRKQFESKRQPLVLKVGKQGAKDLVKAADHMEQVRTKYNIPENKPHLTSIVLDEHNRAFEGHNQQARQFCRKQLFEPDVMSDYSRPSLTNLEKKFPDAKPPLDRQARTCAEHRAYHKCYKDQPNAVPENTRVATVRYDKREKAIRAVERCNNCKAYAEGMGEAPGDFANGMEVPNHPGIGKYSCYKEGAKAVGLVASGAYLQEHREENYWENNYKDSGQNSNDEDIYQESKYKNGYEDRNYREGDRESLYESMESEDEYENHYRESNYEDDQDDNYVEGGRESIYEESGGGSNVEDSDSENEYNNGYRESSYYDDYRGSNYEESDHEDNSEVCDQEGDCEDNVQENDYEDNDQEGDYGYGEQANFYDESDQGSSYGDGQESDYDDGGRHSNYEYGDRERNYDDDREGNYEESNDESDYKDGDNESDYEDGREGYYEDCEESDSEESD